MTEPTPPPKPKSLRKRILRNLGRALLSSRLTAWVIVSLVHAYSWTFTLKLVNEEKWWKIVDEDREPILVVAFHRDFYPALRHFKRYRKHRPGVMISQSKDGEIGANLTWISGWRAVRGSSSQGGKEAMEELSEVLKEACMCGHVVDGPRGPAGRVKPGAIRIAHKAGARIVSFSVEVDRCWNLRSWDRFMIPKPFSTVTMTFADPFVCEPTTDPDAFEAQRLALETAMRAAARYSDDEPAEAIDKPELAKAAAPADIRESPAT